MKNRLGLMAGCLSIGAGMISQMMGCAAPGRTGRAALPGVVVDQDTQIVRVDGKVCIKEGILEYLAVAKDGKEYESVFALDCRPSHLQAAMLIMGYQTGEVAPELRGDFSPQADPAADIRSGSAPRVTSPSGEYFAKSADNPTHVTIDVDVQQPNGTWKRYPAERFLLDRSTGQPPARLTWAFTGSFFHRDEQTRMEFFVADAEKSLVALWYDPTALLNPALDAGNPYRGDAAGFSANTADIPARGTPVRLVLRPRRGGLK